MQPSATRLNFMFDNSKVWQKAACIGGAVLPSAKLLETLHISCSQQADGESLDCRDGLKEAKSHSLRKHS